MTFIEICPDCQSPIRVYENGDGTAQGRCVCGLLYTIDDQKKIREGETDPEPVGYWGFIDMDPERKVQRFVGAFKTLREAEKATCAASKLGRRCYIEHGHKIVSEWIDGEREDLRRKIIAVKYDYTDHEGNPRKGSSTIITTEDTPTFKAIEYYITRYKVTGFIVTNDAGTITEEAGDTSTPAPETPEARP